MKKALLILFGIAMLSLAGGVLFVRLGAYDIAATESHTRPVYVLMETVMRHSVRVRADRLTVPPLDAPALALAGAGCFRQHCLQCHGGPGVAPSAVGMSLQPLPGSLVDVARRWRPQDVYWITRHGIKMSGMPAWELRLAEEQLWAVTAFVGQLAELSPAGFAQRMREVEGARCEAAPDAGAQALREYGPRAGAQLLLRQYACVGCHRVPGVVGSDTQVGPPLDELSRREFLPGGVPMSRDNLQRWIRAPQQLRPGSAMPDLGVSEAHARLMADYLLQDR